MALAQRSAPERSLRPVRESGFLDGCGELAAELRWACPAVVLPSGARRSSAELPNARMFVVEDGVVLVRSNGGEGLRSMVVACCSAGAVLSPLGPDEYLQSLTDAWLTAVPAAAWRRLLESQDAVTRLLDGLEDTAARQRNAVRALAGIRHVDRVRNQLLELARDHGRVCRDGVRLDLPLTHDLIADMVGCARETVTRAFDELQRSGFVERRGRFYQLLIAPEALSA